MPTVLALDLAVTQAVPAAAPDRTGLIVLGLLVGAAVVAMWRPLLRLLHQHVTKVFAGQAEPLEMREADMSLPHRPTDPVKLPQPEHDRRKADYDAWKAARKQNPEMKRPAPISPRRFASPRPPPSRRTWITFPALASRPASNSFQF